MRRRRAPQTARFSIAPFVVALCTALVFLGSLRNGWVTWDDDKNFLENDAYRGLDAGQLDWMWHTFHLGHYVPLSWMSLGLDYTLWGMAPAGYHLTSLLLHVANAVLLYFVARRLVAAARGGDDETTGALAVTAALLWAVHPLRVESVAWITERRDVLSGGFYFTALLAYLRSRDERPGAGRWYAGAVIAFAAALLSKATAVTLPVLLLVVNVYPLRRLGGAAGWWNDAARRVYRELAPFVALAGAASALTFVALQPVEQLGVPGKLAVSSYSLVFYLVKTLVPVGLAPLYEMPAQVSLATPRFAGAVAMVALLAFAVWRAASRRPAVAACVVAFVGVSLPLLGVHQNGPQIAADRYTYDAGAALALLMAMALFAVPRAGRQLAAALIAALALLTVRQVGVWHDGESMWTQVVRVEPRSALGNNDLGNLLMQRGAVDSARIRYETAVAARPEYADAHADLGVAYARLGRLDDATREFSRAVAADPRHTTAHADWGSVLARLGQLDSAIAQYREALAIDPANADAEVNWANALVRAGRAAEADAHYRAALALRPQDVPAHLNWGAALAQRGRLDSAAAQFRAVLAVDPDQADARRYLAQATHDLDARTKPR